MIKKEPRCPLCGAHLTAEELLDAAEEVIDAELGAIAGHCPHCQGRLELMPAVEQLDVGYLNASGSFDVVLSLPLAGLLVERADDDALLVSSGSHHWRIASED
jgi:hypothetical protein